MKHCHWFFARLTNVTTIDKWNRKVLFRTCTVATKSVLNCLQAIMSVSCRGQIKSSFWIIPSIYKPNGSVFPKSMLFLIHLTSKPHHWASDVQLVIPDGEIELVYVKSVYKIAPYWRDKSSILKLQNKIWDMKHWNSPYVDVYMS